MQVHLSFGGTTHGPFVVEELQLLWRAGEIPADALYWMEGMPSWQSVSAFQVPSWPTPIQPRSVILTTTPTVANREIEVERDIVTAECVLGIDFIREFFANITDFVGGRSEGMQKELRHARRACLQELRKEAAELEANAVVGVHLNYSEISGGGRTMLFLVASGTAVRLRPVPPPIPSA